MSVTTDELTVAVIGAGGKMGQRVSRNLAHTVGHVFYCESSSAARALLESQGRTVTEVDSAVPASDVVILAVPDIVLGEVSESIVPAMKADSILLTLDPAAAYAGLLAKRADIHCAVAHPCHPSVFLERTTKEEWSDTFGGVAAPQDVVAAMESGDVTKKVEVESIVRAMYAPVVDVHWVTVTQLAVLEPTLVETVVCMISALLKEALDETVNIVGVPETAARAMLFGHIQIALANALRGSNPFSDACLIAMDYGRKAIVREDWKKIFDFEKLDLVIARMLQIDAVTR
jgi:hypothetical protein